MDKDTQEHDNVSSRFHTVQPLRDLESNWAVDLAKNLEDYLLKICSGELIGGDEDAHFSVNFAEAALLLQGSIQVYSRKVEYLYNLVLHTLEYISQSRSQEHVDSTSAQKEVSSSHAVQDEDDQFWVSDDIPVEGKNCLDNVTSKDIYLDNFVKPPANLVVLEGDCLDSTGDGGELESYLLATNDLYRDFILLDPCDAIAVDEFLKGEKYGDVQYGRCRGSSLISKAHKSFLSPARQSGGTAHRSASKTCQDHFVQASPLGATKENLDKEFGPGPSNFTTPCHDEHGFESDDNRSHHDDLDDSGGDDDDPWKPLNPHEPGNLKVKPFRKVKVCKRTTTIKQISIGSQFPLAKLQGIVCPEFTEIWEMRFRARERQPESQPPQYEKLRGFLADGYANHDSFCPPKTDTKDMFDDEINDFDQDDFDMPDVACMDEQVNFQPDKHHDFDDHHHFYNARCIEDPYSQENLEDLCRAHLDALLASISESEKQTELAARVSTWKQRIENDLEEEDSRPPFDIHEYGEMVLDKLLSDDAGTAISFTDVVKGQEKHDIARTFSALLQLVNDRKVDLDRGTSVDDSFCYTDVNPFNVRLLSNTRGPRKMQFGVAKKRPKSPITKKRNKRAESNHSGRESSVSSPSPASSESPAVLSKPTCKFSAKMNANVLKTTPDGKRRRRSRLAESGNLKSAE
ncbi:hypothetical protein RND81_12G050000 [Saponaria officinalis]|uniref:Condensin-2 complex subunit H2 n=1 Tax=Saponaria officinalis TaxID=3572 RepID=A0AAW1H3B7_SAPOF